MIELETTYLAKYLPEWWNQWSHKEIIDAYLPTSTAAGSFRLRKNGEHCEMTKKVPIDWDVSQQQEYTIPLSREEFKLLVTNLPTKQVHKVRYYYNYEWRAAEIDVFQWELKGLVVVDFEFDTVEEKDNFMMPEFCLVDITPELFIAWSQLCGKNYQDIEQHLTNFNYQPIYL